MKIKEALQKRVMVDGKVSKKRVALWSIGLLMILLLVIYIGFSLYFMGHFTFRTTINQIGVSAASVSGVEKKIAKNTDAYELTLEERDGSTEVICGEDIALTPVLNDHIKQLMKKQNGFAWPYYLFHPNHFEVATMFSYDEEALDEQIANLSCMDESKWTESVDAKILEYTKDGYKTQKAVYGTTIDTEAFRKEIKASIESLSPTLDMGERGCYADPKFTEEDETFCDTLDKLNSYTGLTITYHVDGEEEDTVLDGDTIHTWLSVSDKCKVVLDEDAIAEYVKSLAKKYNTIYGNRTLDTSYGQTVTIYGGNYGWKVDNEAEQEMIIEDLKAGKDVEREPVYAQTANSHGEHDYGDTYVEINLTAQHLFFYKNGELIVESDFVSGNLAKNFNTPCGSYGLTYKAKDATLRGDNYESHVSFWMPFNGNVGMHDASWRSAFGGSYYKRSGSHGCVNLPYSAAKKIYENIEAGYPVLVYELPGTETPLGIAMDAAAAWDDAAVALGPVTLDSAGAVADLRARYDALSDTAKSHVKKLDILTTAETILSQLQSAQQDAADVQAANAVIGQIQALPETITEADRAAVVQARSNYNALSDGAKAKVPSDLLNKLSAAETVLAL